MSTPCGITVRTGTNQRKQVYNHCDGHLNWAGKRLHLYHNSHEQAKELVSHGDISLLKEKIHPDPDRPHNFDNRQDDVCVFYKRDRGDEDVEAQVLKNVDSIDFYPFNYFHDGKESMYRSENEDGWVKLSQVLKKEGII